MTPESFRAVSWQWLSDHEDVERRAVVERLVSDEYWADESDNFKDTLRILGASLYVGTSADRIARFLGLNRDKFVRPRVKRLRDNGVFVGREIHADWLDEKHGAIHLAISALVAEGLIKRAEVST